jgi:hypothetical protein
VPGSPPIASPSPLRSGMHGLSQVHVNAFAFKSSFYFLT